MRFCCSFIEYSSSGFLVWTLDIGIRISILIWLWGYRCVVTNCARRSDPKYVGITVLVSSLWSEELVDQAQSRCARNLPRCDWIFDEFVSNKHRFPLRAGHPGGSPGRRTTPPVLLHWHKSASCFWRPSKETEWLSETKLPPAATTSIANDTREIFLRTLVVCFNATFSAEPECSTGSVVVICPGEVKARLLIPLCRNTVSRKKLTLERKDNAVK